MAGGASLGAVYMEGTIRMYTQADMSALGVKERSEVCLPLLLLTALYNLINAEKFWAS